MVNIKHLRLCFVASFTGGIAQAGDLANYFRTEGATVITTSTKKNIILRAFDIFLTLFINRKTYDYVIIQSHSFLNFLYTIEVLFVSYFLRKKFIIMYLGGGAQLFFTKWGRYISRIFRSADEVVVGSGFLEKEFNNIGIIPTVIPAVMKLSEWKFSKREIFEPKILWLRHLLPEYNPYMAIDVIAGLKKSRIDANLTFVGKPVLQSELEVYSKKLGVSENIIYAGFINPKELQNYYNNHDIFINTTHVDNQPRSVLEAQACGLPVVTTNVGGCPFIVEHERNGYLVNDCDSIKMAEYIINIVYRPADTIKIVKNAYLDLEKYQWKNVKLKWLILFDKLGD